MSAFYSVIQFVPDPVADERVNAGVVVFGEGRVLVRFVENWDRLRRFGNKDVSFLKQFARDLEKRIRDGTTTEEMLRDMAANWRNAIQFTSPRGSLLGLEQLIADAEDRFLANDNAPGSRPFTRKYMKKLAFDAACLAFVQRGGEKARRLVKRDFPITGAITDHPFSLAIANGQPLIAAEVFSFVGSSERNQEKDVMATAFAFEDVQRQHRDLDLAALVLVGDETPPAFKEATKVFAGLGARMVPKDEIDEWADEIAGKIVK
jgi:Protein of unknown function (DUF3037)